MASLRYDDISQLPEELRRLNAKALGLTESVIVKPLASDTPKPKRVSVTIDPRKLSEAQFQLHMIDTAHIYGWKVVTFRPARIKIKGEETYRTPFGADGKGFVDLVLVRPGQILFVELKSDVGKLSREQEDWADDIVDANCEYHLWRPRDWDTIVKRLECKEVECA